MIYCIVTYNYSRKFNLTCSFIKKINVSVFKIVYFSGTSRLREPGNYQDVVFNVRGRKFPAHRCILSARSSYFSELFRTRWKGRKEIVLKHQLVGCLCCLYNHEPCKALFWENCHHFPILHCLNKPKFICQWVNNTKFISQCVNCVWFYQCLCCFHGRKPRFYIKLSLRYILC